MPAEELTPRMLQARSLYLKATEEAKLLLGRSRLNRGKAQPMPHCAYCGSPGPKVCGRCEPAAANDPSRPG